MFIGTSMSTPTVKSIASPHCFPDAIGSLVDFGGFLLHAGHLSFVIIQRSMHVLQKLLRHEHAKWCGACMMSVHIEQTTADRGMDTTSSLLRFTGLFFSTAESTVSGQIMHSVHSNADREDIE